MTTHVPSGTPDAAVDDIRARETAHTRELAAQGHVLRLWRPPLAPGNGGRSGSSPPPTPTSLSGSSPRCRCGSGARMRSGSSPPSEHPAPLAVARAAASGEAATEFLVTFTPPFPAGNPGARLGGGRGPRGRPRSRARRPRPSHSPVGTARGAWRVVRARPVASQRRGGDGGDPGVAAAVSVLAPDFRWQRNGGVRRPAPCAAGSLDAAFAGWSASSGTETAAATPGSPPSPPRRWLATGRARTTRHAPRAVPTGE